MRHQGETLFFEDAPEGALVTAVLEVVRQTPAEPGSPSRTLVIARGDVGASGSWELLGRLECAWLAGPTSAGMVEERKAAVDKLKHKRAPRRNTDDQV